ncbi:unnamed protein product [Absidia cylindrospora]
MTGYYFLLDSVLLLLVHHHVLQISMDKQTAFTQYMQDHYQQPLYRNFSLHFISFFPHLLFHSHYILVVFLSSLETIFYDTCNKLTHLLVVHFFLFICVCLLLLRIIKSALSYCAIFVAVMRGMRGCRKHQFYFG